MPNPLAVGAVSSSWGVLKQSRCQPCSSRLRLLVLEDERRTQCLDLRHRVRYRDSSLSLSHQLQHPLLHLAVPPFVKADEAIEGFELGQQFLPPGGIAGGQASPVLAQ